LGRKSLSFKWKPCPNATRIFCWRCLHSVCWRYVIHTYWMLEKHCW